MSNQEQELYEKVIKGKVLEIHTVKVYYHVYRYYPKRKRQKENSAPYSVLVLTPSIIISESIL